MPESTILVSRALRAAPLANLADYSVHAGHANVFDPQLTYRSRKASMPGVTVSELCAGGTIGLIDLSEPQLCQPADFGLCRDLAICRHPGTVTQRLLEVVLRRSPRRAGALDMPSHAVVVAIPHPSPESAPTQRINLDPAVSTDRQWWPAHRRLLRRVVVERLKPAAYLR
jgi:hypothetical protein